jgi:hypothetical protein
MRKLRICIKLRIQKRYKFKVLRDGINTISPIRLWIYLYCLIRMLINWIGFIIFSYIGESLPDTRMLECKKQLKPESSILNVLI